MAGACASVTRPMQPAESQMGSAAKGVSSRRVMGFEGYLPFNLSVGLRLGSQMLLRFLSSRLIGVPQADN